MAANLPTATDHPWAAIMNAGRKIVFSRTMSTAGVVIMGGVLGLAVIVLVFLLVSRH